MEDYERWILCVFAAGVLAKLLQQLALLCAPVRVPPRTPSAGADAVRTARDAAEWALYAKEGRQPGCKRLGLTLALLAAVAACVPVWWRLTEVHRAPLPFTALAAAALAPTLAPVLRLHVLRVVPETTGDAASDMRRIVDALADVGLRHGVATSAGVASLADCSTTATAGSDVSAAPPVPRWDCAALAVAAEHWQGLSDAQLDDWLQARGGADAQPGAYTLVLLPGGSACDAAPVTYGVHRHAWVRCALTEVASVAASAAARFAAAPNGAAPPPVSSTGTLRLEFTLCNAAPSEAYRFTWDADALERIIAPMTAALAPLCALRVGSSVLLHTALGEGVAPEWNAARGTHVLPRDALARLVDPAWPLHAPEGAPHERVLQLLAFVAAPKQCPLELAGGARGFTSPDWGGVVVWNPPGCGGDNVTARGARELDAAELRGVMAMFAAQLRTLLGLPAAPGADVVPATRAAFAAWEVDALARRAAIAHAVVAGESLAALGRVVKALPGMVISDTIASMAARGLHAATMAARAIGAGRHAEATALAAAAHEAAEGAFFHPSILSLLYFPGDHKLAVYMPLFLPVLLPLTLAAMREGRHYRRRRAFAAAFRMPAE